MEKIKLTKSQKILFIILAIVLVYAIFDFMSHKDRYVGFYSGKRRITNTSLQKNQKKEKKQVDQLQTRLFSQWGSDPFMRVPKIRRKGRKKKKAQINLNLKAISYRSGGSVALVNDRVIKVGDIINGYKVILIDKKKVVLWNGVKRMVLELTNM